MKKRVFAIACVIIILFVPITTLALGMETYNIEEIGITIDIPSDWVAFTRDIDESNPILKNYGYTKEQLLAYMKESGIFLNAAPQDGSIEVIVRSFEIDFEDLNLLSDSELKTCSDGIVAEGEKAGMTITPVYEPYQHKQAKFLIFNIQQKIGNTTVYGIEYFSVVNRKSIAITMQSYTGSMLSNSQEQEFKDIIDSTHFSGASAIVDQTNSQAKNTSNNIDSRLSITNIVFGLLLTSLVYTIPIIIYRYLIHKEPVEKKRGRTITIIYAVCAFILMSLIKYVLGDSNPAGYSIVLWSYINYNILVRAKKKARKCSEENIGSTIYTSSDIGIQFDSTPTIIQDSQVNINSTPSTCGEASEDIHFPTIIEEKSIPDNQPSSEHISSLPSPYSICDHRRLEKQPYVYCHQCGVQLPANAKYCNRCGTQLLPLNEEDIL